MAINTIGDLILELSDYPHDTRIDFVMLGEDWEDCCYDTPLNAKGIVGSGDTFDTDVKYIELGLESA
jgi:hypothetical protein|tara:strand:+ start:298 stop:498 length:201 start_codon:yes stop_codon:yes gene_type:complete